MKVRTSSRSVINNMILVVLALMIFSVDTAWSQETVAVFQAGNKTLKFTNTLNQAVADVRVKNQAVPDNGNYVIEVVSTSPLQAVVQGNPPINIIADGFSWNELTGLASVEIVFGEYSSLSVGDQTVLLVENETAGKDNGISLRQPDYPNQEPYRVYSSMWTLYNYDGGHTRGLIQFDLSNLPEIDILSAEICLIPHHIWYRSNNPPEAGITMYRILKSWKAGTGDGINNASIDGVTGYERWFGNNVLDGGAEDWSGLGLAPGLDYDETSSSSTVLFSEIGPPANPDPKRFFAFDVTDFVQGWLDGIHGNYGLLVKGNDIADDAVYGMRAGYHMWWWQSEYSENTTWRPKLKVKYFEDKIPPDIRISVTPDILWPPNHKMIDVVTTVTVSDNCDPTPNWELVSIVSNEPEEGPGKKHEPDIAGHEIGTPDVEFQLRSERLGQMRNRIYTITYRATDVSNNSAFGEVTVTVPHDMKKNSDSYKLYSNHPNPFNPITEIRFQIPEENHVLLEVYNISGEKIKTLINSNYNSGDFRVRWNGKDEHDRDVSSGVYIYWFKAGNYMHARKMFLIR